MTAPDEVNADTVSLGSPPVTRTDRRGFSEALQIQKEAQKKERGALKILLVDDQVENLLALEAILGDLNHDLIRAKSGREALRHILKHEIALVLLDVRMPHLTGFETARIIRERERSSAIPIIFLTAANSSEEMVFEGYSAGGVDYIVKPFVPEILRAKVEVFLSLAAARQKLEDEVKLRRAMEKELERSAESLHTRAAELEAANQELEAFAYSASHDLRGPLRHIDGFARLLAEEAGPTLDKAALHFLNKISHSTRKMGQLLDGLLSFSRMGRDEMSRRTVELDPLLDEVLADLEPETESRDIYWRRGTLPSVSGDPAMLRRVLVNVVSNAIKYTYHRTPAEIEIGHYLEGDDDIIFVRDNGAGFDMQHYDKLFRVFHRLHNDKDFEGTGIGLASVQRIIHRHGGRIWAQAEIDRGATFFMAFPVSTKAD